MMHNGGRRWRAVRGRGWCGRPAGMLAHMQPHCTCCSCPTQLMPCVCANHTGRSVRKKGLGWERGTLIHPPTHPPHMRHTQTHESIPTTSTHADAVVHHPQLEPAGCSALQPWVKRGPISSDSAQALAQITTTANVHLVLAAFWACVKGYRNYGGASLSALQILTALRRLTHGTALAPSALEEGVLASEAALFGTCPASAATSLGLTALLPFSALYSIQFAQSLSCAVLSLHSTR